MLLVLSVPVGEYPLEYIFEMIPVARERVDALESLIKDCQEDTIEVRGNIETTAAECKADVATIKALVPVGLADTLRELTRRVDVIAAPQFVFISRRSTTACAINQFVVWNVAVENAAAQLFEVSPDQTTITVVNAGVYQVNVRLTNNDSSGSRQVVVYVNNAVTMSSFCGQNTGHYNSIQISEPIRLAARAQLKVQHSGNQPTYASAPHSHFSIMQMC